MKENLKNTSPAVSLAAAVRDHDDDVVNGTGVDLLGYNSALVIATIGTEGDTLSGSLYISMELEESDDNSTYTDVASADMAVESPSVASTNGQFGLADTNSEAPTLFQCAYMGEKRYIRVVDHHVGTHATGTISAAVVLRGHPSAMPST